MSAESPDSKNNPGPTSSVKEEDPGEMEKDFKPTEDPDLENISKTLGSLELKAVEKLLVGANVRGVQFGEYNFPVHPLLVACFQESFFTWISATPESFDSDEVLMNVKDDALKEIRDSKAPSETKIQKLRLSPMGYLCRKLAKGFFHVILRNEERAEKVIKHVEEMNAMAAKEGLLVDEYVKSVQFMVQGVEAFKLSLFTEEDKQEETLKAYIQSCIHYDDLSRRARFAVNGAKYEFYSLMRYQPRKELVRLYQELCVSDPEIIEWRIQLYLEQRNERKEDRNARPTEGEMQVISECLKLQPNHIMVRLMTILFLGDTLKTRGSPREKISLELGNLKFESEHDIKNYAYEVARSSDVLEAMEYSVKTNLHVAEVFSLPAFRELDAAFQCLRRALRLKPERSKVNHRMGLYYLREKKFSDALMYCKKAYELHPVNFPALMDVFNLLLRDVKGNRNKIQEIIHVESNNPKRSNSQRGDLHVHIGIFYLMEEKHMECLDAWKTAFQLNKPSLGILQFLMGMVFRYGWNRAFVIPEEVARLLESELEVETDASAKEFLKEALGGIRTCIRVSREREQQRQQNRGRGNFHHGRNMRQRGGGGGRSSGGWGRSDRDNPSMERSWR